MTKQTANLHIETCSMHGRKGWLLSNGKLSVFVMKGGGHIAGLFLEGKDLPNPMWIPKWGTIEPDVFEKNRKRNAKKYSGKLLACIAGHNLCLPYFGGPSADETKVEMECHGEAPIVNWKVTKKSVDKNSLSFGFSCVMPEGNMALERTIYMQEDNGGISIKETLTNLSKLDKPFTMCQHVTFSGEFLKENVTRFDMPATNGCTYPRVFSNKQRLKVNTLYKWPYGPGSNGKKIDLRYMSDDIYSDFHTNLIDTKLEKAWFTAFNPEINAVVAYVWNRKDYPWVGIWEERYCRDLPPWNLKEFTRGMEFANTPFPQPFRDAVDLGTFQGEKTFSWLPAKSSITFEYDIFYFQPPAGVKGIKNLNLSKTKKLNIEYL